MEGVNSLLHDLDRELDTAANEIYAAQLQVEVLKHTQKDNPVATKIWELLSEATAANHTAREHLQGIDELLKDAGDVEVIRCSCFVVNHVTRESPACLRCGAWLWPEVSI